MSLPNPNMDFTALDVLTAAEMDDLVENIEALADGSGLNSTAVLIQSNPYKFSAYRNASFTISNGSYAKVVFDTEKFDTNNNFATGSYTCPINGFYQFNWRISHNNTGNYRVTTTLIKNSTGQARGADVTNAYAGSTGSAIISCSAGDVIDIHALTETPALSGDVASPDSCYFNGFLVSRT